jgi:ribosome-binding ATPase YchF (GTP1/OBG family)
MLDLITFFSAGKKEIKAWSIKKGISILEAAKKIHSDIKRGFIKGEVISYDNFLKYKGENNVRIAGKCKIEGKKYIVKDGDMINFKFNV